MKITKLSVLVLVLLATVGVWSLWSPVYFAYLIPPTVAQMTPKVFVRAALVSAGVGVAWALFSWRVVASLGGAGSRGDALAAFGLSLVFFLALAGRFLWQVHQLVPW